MIKRLDEDELSYLNDLETAAADDARRKRLEEEAELESFRSAVSSSATATAAEPILEVPSLLPKGLEKRLSSGGGAADGAGSFSIVGDAGSLSGVNGSSRKRDFQSAILQGAVIRPKKQSENKRTKVQADDAKESKADPVAKAAKVEQLIQNASNNSNASLKSRSTAAPVKGMPWATRNHAPLYGPTDLALLILQSFLTS
jgi:hypothetical protein